jgi:hypothetical protein
VIAKEKIKKLEALLAQVEARANAPRNGKAAHVVVPSPIDGTELHVPAAALPAAAEEADREYDVEVSTEVVEVDIDIDEPTVMESGSQPVAAVSGLPEADEESEFDDAAPRPTEPSRPSMPEEIAQAAANEIEEPAPSSSPRPIEAQGYEDESAPRHTPPPESGKQVSTAPATHPPSSRRSSMPPELVSDHPASLEGHTLIGGWREPGIPYVAPPGGGGVRVPAPPPSAPQVPAVPAAQAPQSSRSLETPRSQGRLAADVTRPNLPVGAKVATIEGSAPAAKPANFGELLDWTLEL